MNNELENIRCAMLWLRFIQGLLVGFMVGIFAGCVATAHTPNPAPVLQKSLTTAPTAQESALLFAIKSVESGGNYSAISSDFSHFGAYQLSADLFDGFMPPEQDAAALAHLRVLEAQDGGFNPATLAVQWRGKFDMDYVTRVEHVYSNPN